MSSSKQFLFNRTVEEFKLLKLSTQYNYILESQKLREDPIGQLDIDHEAILRMYNQSRSRRSSGDPSKESKSIDDSNPKAIKVRSDNGISVTIDNHDPRSKDLEHLTKFFSGILSFTDSIEDDKERIRKLETEARVSDKRLTELEKESNRRYEELKRDSETKYSSLNKRHEKLGAEHNDLRSNYHKLNQTLTDVKVELTDVKIELSDVKEQNKTLLTCMKQLIEDSRLQKEENDRRQKKRQEKQKLREETQRKKQEDQLHYQERINEAEKLVKLYANP